MDEKYEKLNERFREKIKDEKKESNIHPRF